MGKLLFAQRSEVDDQVQILAIPYAALPEHGADVEQAQASYLQEIPKQSRAAAREGGGEGVLVGGASAVERDIRTATARDLRLIVPLVLIVVSLILILLLRAIAAPLLLIGTVVVSFFAALGVGFVVSDVIFGFPGVDPGLPLYAFVFLVALGIDYNIFLMARVREETITHGTREGMLRGLAVTGGVITSAGIVLAGTFSVLAVLPLVFLTQMGVTVAFGVLLDTFLVRSVLVPALTLDIGSKIWWPSALASGGDRPAPEPLEATEPPGTATSPRPWSRSCAGARSTIPTRWYPRRCASAWRRNPSRVREIRRAARRVLETAGYSAANAASIRSTVRSMSSSVWAIER